MPLPVGNITWPPLDPSSRDIATWSAWYSGDVAQLAGLTLEPGFTHTTATTPTQSLSNIYEGFWVRESRRVRGKDEPAAVHAPLAGLIAAKSASLLFSEMPRFNVKPSDSDDRYIVSAEQAKRAQARIEDLLTDENIGATLYEAAEACAGLGGVFLRATWDTSVSDNPFVVAWHADQAVPEWRYDRLHAVTFWRELPAVDKQKVGVVWRHLERHEPGRILNGLYMGDARNLGIASPTLEAHPETAGLFTEVPLPVGFPTPLDVVYIPNVKPYRRHRGLPIGRADIAGCETELDALDETKTSKARDVFLGKGKIIVPEDALEQIGNGRGAGKRFDHDRTVFTGLSIHPTGEMQGIEAVQHAIRAQEHLDIELALTESIVMGAGYAPPTFGLGIAGRAESGTAARIRESATFETIGLKRGYWTAGLERLFLMLLAIDNLVLSRTDTPITIPNIEWPPLRETDPVEVAQAAALWGATGSISKRSLVQMRLGSDADASAVDDELALIDADSQAAMDQMVLPSPDGDPVGPNQQVS